MSNLNKYRSTAQQLVNQLGLSGEYWVNIVQAFMTTTRPLRNSLREYLIAQRIAYLNTQKVSIFLSQKGDTAASQINSLREVILNLLQPLNNIFKVVPVDKALNDIPEVAEFLSNLSKSVPLAIPDSVATTITGVAGFDFLDGITSFQDLQDRLDDLLFRASRATSLSTYGNKAIYVVEGQLEMINNYINVLDTLDTRNL